jgi:hypothetical protein
MEPSETSIAMAAWLPHPDAVLRQPDRARGYGYR